MSNKNAIDFAVIGGTGLTEIDGLEVIQREVVHTPFGEPSGQFTHGLIGDKRIVFLARHGYTHTIPPHKVNYRANIWALHHLGVRNVLAVAAVGGITAGMKPQTLVIPDQIIDYTHDRPHTFFEEGLNVVTHIDFSRPYSASMREMVIRAATQAGLSLVENATYAATQGPRLETAAEILRLERDGAHIVGMTGMPETALARELGLDYACCAVVSNWAAGKNSHVITMDTIRSNLAVGLANVRTLLKSLSC